MCIICTGEYKNIPDIETINCSGCTELKEIPVIPSLKYLYCNECTALTTFPALPNLALLVCYECTGLIALPVLPRLRELHCYGCTGLTILAGLPNLKDLNCGGCIRLIILPVLPRLEYIYCNGCTWLDHPKNPDFKNNFNKLTKAQNITRRFLRRLHIKNYLQAEAFVAWWYSPLISGGKKAKKEIEKLLTD